MPRRPRTLPPNPVLVLIGRQLMAALPRSPLRTKTALAAHLGLGRDTLTELLYGRRLPGAEADPALRRTLVRITQTLAPTLDTLAAQQPHMRTAARVIDMIDTPPADLIFPPTLGGAIQATLWQRRQSILWLARTIETAPPTVQAWLHDTYRPDPAHAARLRATLPELADHPALSEQESPSDANPTT